MRRHIITTSLSDVTRNQTHYQRLSCPKFCFVGGWGGGGGSYPEGFYGDGAEGPSCKKKSVAMQLLSVEC